MTTLTDEERKALTEYLGEWWKPMGANVNRSFTTPAGLHAVYSRMVENGEWERFQRKAYIESQLKAIDGTFDAWLFCLNCPEQIGERMKMVVEFERRK